MPYQRAQRILSNFQNPTMPGSFGGMTGVGQGFYSPEVNWAQTQTPDVGTGLPGQLQPPQPPGGADPAGRTGTQQGPAVPSPATEGGGPSPSPTQPDATSTGRVTLRRSPFQAGVQQGGVTRPLTQARRFGV